MSERTSESSEKPSFEPCFPSVTGLQAVRARRGATSAPGWIREEEERLAVELALGAIRLEEWRWGRAAAACVNEFIARAYPYRHELNDRYAKTAFSLAACEEEFVPEEAFTVASSPSILGCGSLEPLLGLPVLGPEPTWCANEIPALVATS